MTHPFRFGVQVDGALGASEFVELARRVEALGYSTLYMPDHFVDTDLAPMVGLSVAAAVTTDLRVSALVFANDYKHPAVLAKEIATLDVLSGGRVDLGIGAGWMQVDYDQLGLAYDRPGVRIDRLEEALAVIRGCWSAEPFSFEGSHYRITEHRATPTPVQRPGPPILIGGGGPRILRLAGAHADIVGINPNLRAGAITADAAKDALAAQTRQKVEWIREGAGDRFAAIELQIRYFFAQVTDDAQALAEAMAPMFEVSPVEALESGVFLAGTVDQICDTLVERRETWGVSNVVFGNDNFEMLAPVVARLAGS
ncbi:MAG: TIGR03621 family F420-dependent LLM class oxidoreductase [Actinomycetes bacterium]